MRISPDRWRCKRTTTGNRARSSSRVFAELSIERNRICIDGNSLVCLRRDAKVSCGGRPEKAVIQAIPKCDPPNQTLHRSGHLMSPNTFVAGPHNRFCTREDWQLHNGLGDIECTIAESKTRNHECTEAAGRVNLANQNKRGGCGDFERYATNPTMTQFVRFKVDDVARFSALQAVFDEIKTVKNLDFQSNYKNKAIRMKTSTTITVASWTDADRSAGQFLLAIE